MDIGLMIIIYSSVVIIFLYAFSMLWYSFISKKKGVFILQTFALIVGISTSVFLLFQVNSLPLPDAIGFLFGILFIFPVIIGSIVSMILVKTTTHLLNKK
jgi:hypothetical protein